MIKLLLLSAACAAAMMTHAHAAQAPRPGNLDSRVTSVVYQSNNVVKVSATYGISTMIILMRTKRSKRSRLATPIVGRLPLPRRATFCS